jgi:L-threonylcarbamoyladenylate synthase
MQADIDKALEILKKGGTILYPTDTIWGIGCDATNSKAISKIYQIKSRSAEKILLFCLMHFQILKIMLKMLPLR